MHSCACTRNITSNARCEYLYSPSHLCRIERGNRGFESLWHTSKQARVFVIPSELVRVRFTTMSWWCCVWRLVDFFFRTTSGRRIERDCESCCEEIETLWSDDTVEADNTNNKPLHQLYVKRGHRWVSRCTSSSVFVFRVTICSRSPSWGHHHRQHSSRQVCIYSRKFRHNGEVVWFFRNYLAICLVKYLGWAVSR